MTFNLKSKNTFVSFVPLCEIIRPFNLTTMDTIECTMDTILVPIVKPIVSIVVKSHLGVPFKTSRMGMPSISKSSMTAFPFHIRTTAAASRALERLACR